MIASELNDLTARFMDRMIQTTPFTIYCSHKTAREMATGVLTATYGPPCDQFVNCHDATGLMYSEDSRTDRCIRPTCGWPKSSHS